MGPRTHAPAAAWRTGAALVVAVVAIGCSPAAAAQRASPPVFGLADYIDAIPPPQLGVDARGGAVVAWTQHSYERSSGADAVFAAIRRAGGGFGRAHRISDPLLGMRSYSLAVGSRGHAAIVWESDTVDARRLFVQRRGPDGGFGRRVAVPGARGASEPAAAIDARGRLLVAWLRPSDVDQCGRVVLANVADAGGRFGRARQISEPCAHAGLVRAALARTGDGAVAWRSAGVRGPMSDSHVVVSPYANGVFGVARTVSDAPRVGFTLDLAGGGRRALVVWRDRGAAVTGPSVRGRVLTAAIDGAAIGPAVEVVATPERVLEDVDAAMNAHDAAIVSWAQAPKISFEDRADHAFAAMRPSAFAAFGRPELVVTTREACCNNIYLKLALDRSGRAIAVYYGNYVERRTLAGTWTRRVHLRRRESFESPDYGSSGADGAIGLGDGGEAVAAWLLETDDAPYMRASVIPAR